MGGKSESCGKYGKLWNGLIPSGLVKNMVNESGMISVNESGMMMMLDVFLVEEHTFSLVLTPAFALHHAGVC